jgi:hypothetical protein
MFLLDLPQGQFVQKESQSIEASNLNRTRLLDRCPKAPAAPVILPGGSRQVSKQESGNMMPENIDRNIFRARGIVLAVAGFTALYVVWGLIRVLS